MSSVRTCTPAVVVLLLPALGTAAAPPADLKTRVLIDQLVSVARSDFGYSATASGNSFLPLDREGKSSVAMLVTPWPASSEVMRDLVRQGTAAVPALLAHLGDKRKTRLALEHPIGIGFWTAGNGGFGGLGSPLGNWPAASTYTVTVGDLCYVALGQIVNRSHSVATYIPSGNAFLYPVSAMPAAIADLKKQWGALTPARHRDMLLDEVRRALYDSTRLGACKRLAFYYPDALEPLALQLLALPTFTGDEAERFVDSELPEAATEKDRRKKFDAFVAKHGKVGREAVLRKLFYDLRREEDTPEILKEDPEVNVPRQRLVELFGYKPTVRSDDRPAFLSGIYHRTKLELLAECLCHVRSKKIDTAVRGLLASVKGDTDLGMACVECLAGRGHDMDLVAYARRCRDSLSGEQLDRIEELRGWAPLHAAVARGRDDLVRDLLAAGARPDAPARNGDTPIHLAVRNGDERMLELLLRRKANLDVKGRARLTPAQEAARSDFDAAVLTLVNRGCAIPDSLVAAVAGRVDLVDRFAKADPRSLRAKTEGDRTLLFVAIQRGNAALVKYLLARGAAPNASTKYGWTALHQAAASGHADVVQALLAAKADVTVQQEGSDLTPLHLAAQRGDPDTVRLLLRQGVRVDARDYTGRTALFHAIENRHEAVVRMLLRQKASPRIATIEDAVPPLHAAAASGHAGITTLLLRAGTDPGVQDRKHGENALHRAAREGQVETARLLLDRGARIDGRDKDGNTALMHAVYGRHKAMARLLLARYADVERENQSGLPPLHAAAYLGDTALVELLLQHGANVERFLSANGYFGSPLHLAVKQGHVETVRLLLARKANPLAQWASAEWEIGNSLIVAVQHGQVEIARLLLERGVPVNSKTHSGWTPLHWLLGDEAMLKLLLRYRPAVRARTNCGWEPLHFAARGGKPAIVARLLDHGAAVNAPAGKSKKTALHLAIETAGRLEEKESKVEPMVRLLLARGADVRAKDRKGRTPADVAAQLKFTKLAELLRPPAR